MHEARGRLAPFGADAVDDEAMVGGQDDQLRRFEAQQACSGSRPGGSPAVRLAQASRRPGAALQLVAQDLLEQQFVVW